ncbi:kinase-like domain-containing protein [Gilbertella persicaria]|uniref:Serine/threonine-protein kinase HAL4/sat4 n=1 Tax=Rhizopus stolonifer TaxID=4846 RepID=A0A367JCY0_RHIST|nr:kinase-like domain-containing protein [Gilbertella persicaria]KAI8080106.1 kinase-like domain-containing protein [Gilbertella persicaria]RCH87798.1 serine/threonine-protein kinase HAL4/sat4 [Rhizopus stolonifer]
MVHLSNIFHLPHHRQAKSHSAQSSRRNSRDSSVGSFVTDNTLEEGKHWFFKQLHQQLSRESSPPSTPLQLSPSPSRQTLWSMKSNECINTAHSSSGSTNKPHRMNLREYGECYKRLGKGSTAIISVCRSKKIVPNNTSKLYAIKQFRKRNKHESEKDYMKKLTSEFCISSTFRHTNIVETIDLVLDDQQRYCTVMEYCAGGDLFSAIMSEHMTTLEMSCCFKQMMSGLAYLHSVGVAHRDIKPENLLLTLDGTLKITDFGVSDVFRCAWEKTGHRSHGLVGSEPYIAPEVFEEQDYWGSKLDVWSAGIVLYSMWRGGHAWVRADKKVDREFRNYVRHWSSQSFPNFKKFPDLMRHLLYAMLNPDPDTRLTAEQVLEHDWVKSIMVCEKGIDALGHEHHHLFVKKH